MSEPGAGSPGGLWLTPIGYVACRERFPHEVPRQGALGGGNRATLRLLDDERRLGEATEDLEGFARIWVVSWLHGAAYAGPRVRPPGKDETRRGVFATRAPHRPNPIGLSCVTLVSVAGLTVEIADHDLLHGTPVLDIKPYVPYADAFADVAAGWLDTRVRPSYAIEATERARIQMDWLERVGQLAPWGFVQAQLATNPDDHRRKRIASCDEGQRWRIAYRTWRIEYELDLAACVVRLTGLVSAYPAAELAPDAPDPLGDKAVHREFAVTEFDP